MLEHAAQPLATPQAFKTIRSFLSKLESVSEDPSQLAEVGEWPTLMFSFTLLCLLLSRDMSYPMGASESWKPPASRHRCSIDWRTGPREGSVCRMRVIVLRSWPISRLSMKPIPANLFVQRRMSMQHPVLEQQELQPAGPAGL